MDCGSTGFSVGASGGGVHAAQAKAAADGKDVRIGGGVSTVREFLDADLIDFIHTVTVPVVLGTGVRLWENPEVLDDRFSLESVSTESGLTHRLCNRIS